MKESLQYMNKYFLLFALVLIFSCTEDLETIAEVDNNIMNLENLQVGQKFYYELLMADSYRNGSGEGFWYTGDTLELEVVDDFFGIYTISEKITDGSRMKNTGEDYYGSKRDSTFINTWSIRNDTLFVLPLSPLDPIDLPDTSDPFPSTDSTNEPDVPHNPNDLDDAAEYSIFRSHLMFNFDLNLSVFNQEQTSVRGWKTTNEYIEHDKDLYIKDYELNGNQYEHLNVAINNNYMSTDGPGNTTFYSKEKGIVRTSIYSWWSSDGFGWDKL